MTHRVHPQEGEREFAVRSGGEFSVFALTPCRSVHLHGARWEMDGAPMTLSTEGLHNVASGESVRIKADGVLVVIVPQNYSFLFHSVLLGIAGEQEGDWTRPWIGL